MRIVWLVTPGHEREKIEKSLASSADVVFPCLEDGTPYTDEAKERARENIAGALQSINTDCAVYPRINELTSKYWRDDIKALVPARPDGITVGNVVSPENVQQLSAVLRELESEHGLVEDSIPLTCLVENPRAVRNTYEIAKADPRVEAVLFGADDYTQSLGALKEDEKRFQSVRSELDYPKSKVAMDATAASVEVIDSASTFVDPDYLLRESNKAARFGYTGKIALHPNQISTIRCGFAPTREEVDRSREILERHQEGVGGTINGLLVVEPVVKQAEFVIERHEELGYRDDVEG